MDKILILGGYGSTGRLIARHLLEQSTVELVLAGRNLTRAQALAGELNATFTGGRVSAVTADAADPASLRAALTGVTLLIVASPTTQHTATVVRAALDAGADYLDVQLDAGKLAVLQAQAAEIEAAGRCFITEAGFHPGLPSALVRLAAASLDQVETALTAGFLNMGHNLPYTEAVDELMQAFVDYQAQVYKNGAWSKSSSYDMRTVDFGGQIGSRMCYSMFFEELRALPQLIPGLREVGFYISSTHWVNDWLITPIILVGLKIAPKRGLRPLGRLMWWGMQTFHKPPYIVSLLVDAQGRQDGHPARLRASVSHPDGYELTAVPVVAALLQVLDGTMRKPGLWMMGQLVDPLRLCEDMRRMGVEVSCAIVRNPEDVPPADR